MGKLTQKYGLWMAVSMMVGIVIGSGIFFKADDVLKYTNGSLPLALLAWVIGGLIMTVSVISFSFAAQKVSKSNGLVDYIEAGYGPSAGYYIGWYMTWVYYPALTGVLAWVSGLYTTLLFNLNGGGDPSNVTWTWVFAIVYFIGAYLLNYFSPKLSGKFQVSATVIKLVPITLVAVVGLVVGLINGVTVDNFVNVATNVLPADAKGLAVAVLATSFAYDGWIAATSINTELRNPKHNLPLAFVIGAAIVISAYLLYNLGLAGVLQNSQFVELGNGAITLAVQTLFGSFAGTALAVFVVISCLGTLNGLTLATSRGFYSIAVRGSGFAPKLFTTVNEKSNTPFWSVIAGGVLSIIWSIVWFGNFQGWWGAFMDISELPIALLYSINIAVYIWIIRSFKELSPFKRFVLPTLAIVGSVYIAYGAFQKDLIQVFLVIVGLILILGIVAEVMHKPSDPNVTEKE